MKYLKTYKLFESSDLTKFPSQSDIEEIFYDVTDDNIVQFEYLNEGWWYFFYPSMTREVKSLLYYDMTEYPDDWQTRKTKVPYQTEWQEMFFDITDPKNTDMIIRGFEEIPRYELARSRVYQQYKDKVDLASLNKLPNKTFVELIVDNIIKGKIKGFPYIYVNLSSCLSENFPKVIECIERLYQATGFRPVGEVWDEDYLGQSGIRTYTCCKLQLVKCSDLEYKSLVNGLCSRPAEVELSKLFL